MSHTSLLYQSFCAEHAPTRNPVHGPCTTRTVPPSAHGQCTGDQAACSCPPHRGQEAWRALRDAQPQSGGERPAHPTGAACASLGDGRKRLHPLAGTVAPPLTAVSPRAVGAPPHARCRPHRSPPRSPCLCPANPWPCRDHCLFLCHDFRSWKLKCRCEALPGTLWGLCSHRPQS